MKQSRMTSLEIIRGKKYAETFEIVAILETVDTSNIPGYRLPSEAYGRKLLGILKAFAVEFRIVPMMDDKKIRFAAAFEPELQEPHTWGIVDFKHCEGRCLSVVYNNGRLKKEGSEHLRMVLDVFSDYLKLRKGIDWDWWGGRKHFFSDLEDKLEQLKQKLEP